jgi:hypothetical protein
VHDETLYRCLRENISAPLDIFHQQLKIYIGYPECNKKNNRDVRKEFSFCNDLQIGQTYLLTYVMFNSMTLRSCIGIFQVKY